eukprot:m.58243 g.58243  ORF g.58243 m.58243 type:complete len:60 (-) comp7855_c1_seq1:128-307(-)
MNILLCLTWNVFTPRLYAITKEKWQKMKNSLRDWNKCKRNDVCKFELYLGTVSVYNLSA